MVSSIRRRGVKIAVDQSSLPVSIFEKSRISLMIFINEAEEYIILKTHAAPEWPPSASTPVEKTHNPIQGCADLVAHICQEVSFGHTGRFGFSLASINCLPSFSCDVISRR
jgi:hypothetical protein